MWEQDAIRTRLLERAEHWQGEGFPGVAVEGKLLRPLVACWCAQAVEPKLLEDEDFWDAVLALQMIHEASLAHDDIIDRSKTRRGKPTAFAKLGVPGALLLGDHLLTAAYRLVAKAHNPALMSRFAEAVEQTVAGEFEQASMKGRRVNSFEYSSMIAKKTGALFGFAMSIAPLLVDDAYAKHLWFCGLRLGCQFQRLDDLLDYCSQSLKGKPPLLDFRRQVTTWPWNNHPDPRWDWSTEEVLQAFFGVQKSGTSYGRTLVGNFRDYGKSLAEDLRGALAERAQPLLALLGSWEDQAEEAVVLEEKYAGSPAALIQHDSSRLRRMLDDEGILDPSQWEDYFRKNSRSFSFAAWLFPPSAHEKVTGVYAYCRVTDELADGFGDLEIPERMALLAQWQHLSSVAYRGQPTGIPLVDHVMGQMAEAGVPISYAHDLIEGMRMDLDHGPFADLQALRRYCYCVASTVGLWLTELFGVHDPWVLERAEALGQAMQLTNILRDVGEDLGNGRLYLPQDRMKAHGISRHDLEHMRSGAAPLSEAYQALIEELLEVSEAEYRLAYEGMPALPRFFSRPVAVAASVYGGIHQELRNLRYDNLNQRAVTSFSRKCKLAISGLRRLRAAGRNRRLLEGVQKA